MHRPNSRHLSFSFLLSRHHSLLYVFIVCGIAATSSFFL